jgi:hypothetical protein
MAVGGIGLRIGSLKDISILIPLKEYQQRNTG